MEKNVDQALWFRFRREVISGYRTGLMEMVPKHIVSPVRGGSSKTSISVCTASMEEILGRLNELRYK
jgi:hypothetical protein